jgi:hypothetical protein
VNQLVAELNKEWISKNGVWKVVATIKENPSFPGKAVMAFRHVKIYRFGSIEFEKHSDDGRTPKYVMDKYREFMNLVYEQ